MSPYKLSKEAKERIDVMVSSNDGFEIAEMDMRLRGPGDIEGTQQSGIPFNLKISNLAKDGQIIEYVRRIAEEIIAEDPLLQQDKNIILNNNLKYLFSKQKTWRDIS